jgi:molybdopterin-synthase adenylyltransferase
MENKTLTNREIRRFQPQIDLQEIGQLGQGEIKNSRILVVGSGGKGTAALKALIGAGVGYLGVSDDTLIEEETLSRQSLFSDNDLGKQKAIVAKQYLQERNQLTQIKVHNIRLTTDNLSKVISQYDIIVDATNNFDSHYAISEATILAKKPMVFGHIENNVIYLSQFSADQKKSLKELMPEPTVFSREDQDSGTPIIIVNAIAGNLMANEAIKLILGQPSQLSKKMLKIKLSDYSFNFQAV